MQLTNHSYKGVDIIYFDLGYQMAMPMDWGKAVKASIKTPYKPTEEELEALYQEREEELNADN